MAELRLRGRRAPNSEDYPDAVRDFVQRPAMTPRRCAPGAAGTSLLHIHRNDPPNPRRHASAATLRPAESAH